MGEKVDAMRGYVSALYAPCGAADTDFLPQSVKTHTKAKLLKFSAY